MSAKWYPSDDNIEKLTLDDAKFIFEQAEKLLKDVVETNTLIVGRTTTLITITVGFMLALIGFLFNRINVSHSLFDEQFLTCFLSFLYVFSLCRILVKNIQGRSYNIVGTEPKKLFTNAFFQDEIPSTDRMKFFYLNEIWVCQKKIDENIATNERRWYLFNKALQRLLYTPVVILFFYLVVKTIFILKLPSLVYQLYC